MNIDNQQSVLLRCLPLLTATIAVGTDAWVVAGFLPRLGSDLHASTSTAGLSVTVFAACYSVAAPVVAALTSAARPRRVIAGALVLLALANALCAVAGTFGVFLAGRALAAVAASVVTPAAGVLAARVAGPQQRGRALALVVSGLTIATAVGVPIGAVVADAASWRTALAGVALLSVVAAMLIVTTAPDMEGGARQAVRARLAPLADPKVLSIAGLTAMGMCAAYIPYAYIAVFIPAGNAAALPLVLTGYGVGAIIGSLASGAMTDRAGSRTTLTTAYTLMVASLATLALHPALAPLVLATACWGAASWMQTPPQQHRLLAAAPKHGGVVIGTNASALYAGIALGNALGSILQAHDAQSLIVAASIAALAALAWNLSLGTRSRAAD